MSLGSTGETCLWVSFGGLFIPCIYFFLTAMQLPDGKRYFHTLSFLINFIASCAYLAMATGYGIVQVAQTGGGTRDFFFARYIDWALTTPLMLLDLATLGNASSDTLLWLLSTDFLMIISGLIGGLIGSSEGSCWAFFAFSMFFFMPIVWFLGFQLPVSGTSEVASELYTKVANATIVLWSMYPVVWVLAEGSSIISSDTEVVFYTILDILAKSGFGILICTGREALDSALSSSGGQI